MARDVLKSGDSEDKRFVNTSHMRDRTLLDAYESPEISE